MSNLQYFVSAKGTQISFLSKSPDSPSIAGKVIEGGYVYNGSSLHDEQCKKWVEEVKATIPGIYYQSLELKIDGNYLPCLTPTVAIQQLLEYIEGTNSVDVKDYWVIVKSSVARVEVKAKDKSLVLSKGDMVRLKNGNFGIITRYASKSDIFIIDGVFTVKGTDFVLMMSEDFTNHSCTLDNINEIIYTKKELLELFRINKEDFCPSSFKLNVTDLMASWLGTFEHLNKKTKIHYLKGINVLNFEFEDSTPNLCHITYIFNGETKIVGIRDEQVEELRTLMSDSLPLTGNKGLTNILNYITQFITNV